MTQVKTIWNITNKKIKDFIRDFSYKYMFLEELDGKLFIHLYDKYMNEIEVIRTSSISDVCYGRNNVVTYKTASGSTYAFCC